MQGEVRLRVMKAAEPPPAPPLSATLRRRPFFVLATQARLRSRDPSRTAEGFFIKMPLRGMTAALLTIYIFF